MVSALVGLHAGLGELAFLASLWFVIEIANLNKERVRRVRIASAAMAVFIFLAWIVGGYYYVSAYGPDVKPVIKAGPTPWSHSVFMEVKEHVFLFLPVLSLLLLLTVNAYGTGIATNSGIRFGVLAMGTVIFLILLSMAGMGYMVSSGARSGLEAMI